MPGARACTPPPPEVAAVGREVLADGEVQRAAVGQRLDLLEDALAVGVGADDLGAAVVLERAGDDLGRRGGAAVDQHDHRDLGRDRAALGHVDLPGLAARPSVETIVPSGMKMLATLTASSSRPPPFSRRSRISAWAPWCSTCLDLGAHLGARALGEAGQLDVADLVPVVVDSRLLATGTMMSARVTGDDPACARRACTVSVTLVPAAPLISVAEKSAERLASEVEPTCDDQVAARAGPPWRPASPGTRPDDRRPCGLGLDVDPDPAQMRVGLVLERAGSRTGRSSASTGRSGWRPPRPAPC